MKVVRKACQRGPVVTLPGRTGTLACSVLREQGGLTRQPSVSEPIAYLGLPPDRAATDSISQ